MTSPSATKEQRDRFLELMRDIAVAKERANLTTLSQFAESEANAEGGRHSRRSQIVGTRVAAEYPRLPADSFPAQASAVPNTEPALGFSIDAMEPLGTQAEIERSLRSLSTNHEAGVGCGEKPASRLSPVPVGGGADVPVQGASAPSSSPITKRKI
jgi:hypothetical protein